VLSPPAHSAFQDPPGLLRFVARLRELSGGKPVGFKLCVGRPHEFFAICKAMRSTGITPDFITVDGGEGGTGAAPLEFSNSVGYPLTEALVLVHDALVGFGLRERIRVLASGKVVTGFALARLLALGADAGNSARGMMLALGCIQALRCNNNTCPAGVATQDPALVAGLDPPTKATRVHGFHHGTVHALMELVAAAGLDSPAQLTRRHIHRRIDATYECDYERLYPEVEPGCFLREDHVPPQYAEALAMAQAESFAPAAAARETRRAA
jgi:glutamate synthase domain-containing protein 2